LIRLLCVSVCPRDLSIYLEEEEENLTCVEDYIVLHNVYH